MAQIKYFLLFLSFCDLQALSFDSELERIQYRKCDNISNRIDTHNEDIAGLKNELHYLAIQIERYDLKDKDLVDECLDRHASGRSKPEEKEESTYCEGDEILLNIKGDHGSGGCKFLFYEEKEDVTCCYIDKRRDNRDEYNMREGLCGSKTQPKGCLAHKEQNVTEHDDDEDEDYIEECSMKIHEAKLSHSGEYIIEFPDNPRYNTKRKILVRKCGLYMIEWIGIGFAILVLVALTFLAAIIIFLKVVLPIWKTANENQINQDEIIMKNIRENKIEDLKENLVKRNLLKVMDRDFNNIYHVTAGTELSEEMIKTLINILNKNQDEEKVGFLNTKEEIFRLAKRKDLDKRNYDGNSPLMIVANLKLTETK